MDARWLAEWRVILNFHISISSFYPNSSNHFWPTNSWGPLKSGEPKLNQVSMNKTDSESGSSENKNKILKIYRLRLAVLFVFCHDFCVRVLCVITFKECLFSLFQEFVKNDKESEVLILLPERKPNQGQSLTAPNDHSIFWT